MKNLENCVSVLSRDILSAVTGIGYGRYFSLALCLASARREPEERKQHSKSYALPGEGAATPDPGGREPEQRVNGAPACW